MSLTVALVLVMHKTWLDVSISVDGCAQIILSDIELTEATFLYSIWTTDWFHICPYISDTSNGASSFL